ncbi:MAG: DUF4832 domain-containing protein [Bacteroidales bacterium]|nr:DUF4832 domain-containing protein [Bacteroidales bacterium]
MKRILATLLIPFLALSCFPFSGPIDNEKPEEDNSDVEQVDPSEPLPPVVETYKEIDGAVLNPERGYYHPVDFTSGSSALKASAVKAQRTQGRTLFYLGFYLTDFMKGDISQSYLDKIQNSLDAIREGGAKCILRFAYKSSESNKPWDPSVDIVLRHVEQLKPILQKNEDVIFVLQAGFVGVWGEWYYTQNFIMNPSTDADYQPRRKLTDALLDALPASRQIQLRTPQFKMRMFGLTVKDTLTAKTAHNGTPVSRLAGHNDCFGAAADDWGTFDNESRDRDFWKADTRYTIMGGETCNVSDYCTCQASLKDMEDYHWTFLNSGYHGDVINRWKTQGCGDEINLRLGYRLVLKESYRNENPVAGEEFSIALKIENKGFAAPQNPRNAILVFVAEDGTKSEFRMGVDPRTWHPGESIVRCRFALPAEKGTLYLNLSDPLLPDRPEYSIALANEGVFDTRTGYNKLFTL